jgi:GrpB-like predicted nucleotidyltransferase (UPF0157 family)
MSAPLVIEDYDPRWPDQFELLRARISSALGPLAATIEHVGSTAVPGLAAKPILDIDVLLTPDADLAAVIGKLASLGYEHRGDLGILGREAFRAPAGDFPHHLYICPSDSAEYTRHVAFRDHLLRQPEDADTYATLKRTLATKFTMDREAYNAAKSDFIAQILAAVRLSPTEHFRSRERTIP